MFKKLIPATVWIILIYFFVKLTIPSGTLQSIRMTQYLALSALTTLFVTLLIGILQQLDIKQKNIKKVYLKHSVFLVSTFIFALMHASFGFFTQLGGLAGLPFLAGKFLYAIVLAALALLFLAISQFYLVKKLRYVIGVFVLLHAFFIGTHFSSLSLIIPKLVFIVSGILLFLQGIVVDRWLKRKFNFLPLTGVMSLLIVTFISFMYLRYFSPILKEDSSSLSVHSEHLKAAQNVQNPITKESKRFSVSFEYDKNLKTGQETTIKLRIYDAATGELQKHFDLFSEKFLHLIIVDRDLEYFAHLHPELKDGDFSVTTTFPSNGKYHLYADFQPVGNTEQQFASSLIIGKEKEDTKKWEADETLEKSFEGFNVTLTKPTTLLSEKVSLGEQNLSFTLRKNGSEIKTLHPYLGSFGHLVMISANTFEYIHVHPLTEYNPALGEFGGPSVVFSPIGLYGPVKAGVYRLFGQFNPDGNLITTDFTIEIK